jgi:hypothetical protein
MVDFILKHLKELLVFTGGIVVAVVAGRFKEAIKKGTNLVIDSLLSWARIHLLMLKRYKKSIVKAYRETKVGYRNLRLKNVACPLKNNPCKSVAKKQKDPVSSVAKNNLVGTHLLSFLTEFRQFFFKKEYDYPAI